MPRPRTARRARPVRPAAAPRSRLPLFLAAVFAVKCVVLLQLDAHPLLQPDAGLDASSYTQLARRVLGGDVALGPGLYFLSPLYIYFLAAVLALANSFTVVRVVQIALGTAAVWSVFTAADRWFGRRAAWMAAVLAALTGPFTFYEIVLMQSALDTVLTAAALALMAAACVPLPPEGGSYGMASRAAAAASAAAAAAADRGASADTSRVASAFRRKETPLAALAGLLFGLLILNRPNAIVAVAGMLIVLLLVKRMRVAVLVFAGVMAALAPVVIRNAVVSRQFALVSSQGGLNFYIGNSPAATGHYVAVPGVRANIEGQAEDTRRVAEEAAGRPLTDSDVSRHFTRMAWAWIRTHPADAARLFARKLALVFNARHQWLDFSYPYYAYDTGSLLWALFSGAWLLVPLGLTGLVVCRPPGRRAEYAAWAAFVPLYAISVAIFFVGERYRLPLLIALCAPAGAALDRAARAIATPALRASASPRAGQVETSIPRRSISRSAVALLSGTLVLTLWPLGGDDGRFDERLRLANVLMNTRDVAGALAELEAAHALRPADTVAEFTLGMALVSDGRAAEGIPHVRRAVEAGVTIKGARYALANAMLVAGDRDGAARLLRTYTPAPADDAMSCFQAGVLAMRAGANDVAERYARQALALRPGWPDAEQLLADSRR